MPLSCSNTVGAGAFDGDGKGDSSLKADLVR